MACDDALLSFPHLRQHIRTTHDLGQETTCQAQALVDLESAVQLRVCSPAHQRQSSPVQSSQPVHVKAYR